MELGTSSWHRRSMGWRDETTWTNQAGIFPVARTGGHTAKELPCLRIRVLGTRSLRGRWRGVHSLAAWRPRSSLWHRDRRQSGRTSERTRNRDFAGQHHGCEMPAGGRVLALSEPSVRLGIRGEQQPEIGIGLPRTHLSLAQGWRCAPTRDSATAIAEMCQIAKRTFHGFARVQAHRTGLPAIQTDRSACNAPQTTLQGYGCGFAGWNAVPRSSGNEERA